ncbi:STAS domain-containing protein [Candidatus Uabimicrobium sp. HlEnr_7]|uniref:STAS domain-containing protein n=1 Tax=Candidatus Uabimicrobium helgolandensis TaxID=3095367 RepID=UPI003556088C
MKINTRDLEGNVKLIVFEGHIDENSIVLVQDTFAGIFSLGIYKIICNMKKVDHISAPVLKTFLEHISLVRSRGGDLKLLHVQSSLQGIFRYAGFSDDSVFCNDLNTAVQQFKAYGKDTLGNEDIFSPTMQANQSPLGGPVNNVYGATIQMGSSPLQNKVPEQGGAEDPYGATIQMNGSPLQNRSLKQDGAEDPYGATIQMGSSPLQNKNQKQEDLFGATIAMDDSPLQKKAPEQKKQKEHEELTIEVVEPVLERTRELPGSSTLQSEEELKEFARELVDSPLQNEKQNQGQLGGFTGELIKPSPESEKQLGELMESSLENEDTSKTLNQVADKARKSATESPKKLSRKAKKKRRKPLDQSVVQESPVQQQAPAPKNEEQKVVVTELKRKSTIRFYRRMYPFCIFPLKVIFSQQKLQKIIHKKIEQVEGKQDVVVSKDKPIIEVVPHFPGCLIVPPKKKVDVTPEISHANFTATPLAESKNQKGYVEIYYNGELIDTIENMTYHVEKQTIAKFALYLSLISPVISTSLDVFQVDFNEKLPAAIETLSKFTEFFGGKTGFGFALAGVFLSISAVFYFLKRPREANPIENILPVN